MTDQPQYPSYPGPEQPTTPPPPGYQPPPGYGQESPEYGGSIPGDPAVGSYASWWSRVGAYLLDGILVLAVIVVPLVAGLVLAFRDVKTDPATGDITGGVAALGILVLGLTVLLALGFDIWNRGVRVGAKGQSFGKQIVGIRIVKADSGQLLGGGGGFLRWMMAFVFGLISCVSILDLLWPLWDNRNQTLHDKVVGSIAVQV